MAGEATQNVSIKLNISGEHLKQLKTLADSVTKVTAKVTELQNAINAIGGNTGTTTFSSSHLVSALGEVKTAIAAIKDTGLASVSKSIEALNDKQVNNFAAAIERLKAGLDPTLVQNITAFGNALQHLNVAQTKFSGAETARQVSALLEGLKNVGNVNASHIQAIGNALANLNVGANISSIEAISRLGYALRSIKDFGDGKSPLTNLADGMRSLIGLKASDTFLYRVRQITLAASLLSKSEPVDFSKFTQGLQELGKFEVKTVNWENIKTLNHNIKEAFEELRTVKIPNIKGLMQGLSMINEVYQNLQTDQLRHIATTLVNEFGVLSKLKMPQLGSLTKNLRILSAGEYDFNAVATNINTFKKSLMGLHGIQLPNLGAFIGGFKALTGVSFKGMEQKIDAFTARVKQLKESATLDGWDKIRTPNLSSFVKGIHDLGAIRLDESHLQNINHNIRSIPKKLREIAAIQVPDMTKFASGLLELSRPAINAQKAANTISKALAALNDNLPKHEVKLPNLSGLTKGIRDFQVLQEAGKVNTASITSIATDIKGLVDQLKNIDKVNLPNIQNVASGIHKLSVAVPANAGTIAAGNIEAIVTAVKKLDGVTVPDLTKISKAFDTLNKSYVNYYTSGVTGKYGSSFEHIAENIKNSLASLKDATSAAGKGGGIPNLKGITDSFKVLNDTTLKTEEVFRHGKMGIGSESIFRLRNNLDIIKQAITELQALGGKDANKIPDLKGITNSFTILSDDKLKGLSLLNFRSNIGEIKWAIEELNKVADLKLPNLNPIIKAFRNIDSAIAPGKTTRMESGAIYLNIESIVDAVRRLNSVSNLDLPNLNGISTFLKTFNERIRKVGFFDGKGQWTGETTTRLVENAGHIKTAVEKLGEVGNVSLPNIKGVADAFKIFNDSYIKGKTYVTSKSGWFTNMEYNIDAVSEAIKKLQKLGGKDAPKIPNLKNIADAFKILDEAIPKGKTAFDIHRFDGRIQQIKTAISDLQSLGGKEANKIPNLKSIADAFTALDAIPKNVRVGWTDRFRLNIDQIIEAIGDLQKLGGKGAPKIPNLKSIGDAFVALDRIPVPKDNKFTTGHFEENLSKVEDAIKRLQALGGKEANKIPNLKSIADAFKVLNESALWGFNTWKKGAASGDFVSHIDKNLNEITRVITALQRLNTAVEGGKSPTMPNLKNITDAFKVLNESPIKNTPLRNADGSWNEASLRVSNIKRNLDAIKTALDEVKLDSIKVPNLKNVADAFKILNETPMLFKAGYDTDLSYGIPQIKANLRKLKEAFTENDLSAIKVPNLKNVADAFKTLNSIEKLETVPDAQGTPTRVKHYVDEIAKAFQSANETLKDVKLPNIKNVADAFRTLNSIEVKDDKSSNFVKNLSKVWEQLRLFKRDTELQDIKFPNLKNIADAFRTLDTVLKPSDKINTGKFEENFKAVKGAIEQLKDFDKLKLPNLKNIADAFNTFNGSVLVGWNTPGKGAITRVQQNIDEVVQALNKLKDTEVTKLPNLKNIADAFNILGTIPKGMAQDNRIDVFKTNIEAIINVLHESREKLNKIQLPNLKNIADGFAGLSSDRLLGIKKLDFIDNVHQVKWAISELTKVCTDAQGKQFKLPNLEGIAKAFKVLNSEELKSSFKWEGGIFPKQYVSNLEHNVRAIVAALKEFEGKNFDLPNINNLATGLQKLNNISKINQDLAQNMQTLKDGLEVLRGVQVPKQFKNFADGLHSLQEFSKKSTGTLISTELATDLTALAKALGQFTGITLPPNLQGFAKGIEAIAKVNIKDFTQKFGELVKAMHTLNLNVPQTAIDALAAKLVVCEHALHTVQNRLSQTASSFAGFGNSTKPAEDGLTRLQERIKMFLQYRVISNLFNRITNAIQAIPNNIKEFEKSMYNVQSITGATDNTVAKLGVTVKEIASTTKFSAQEVADGMTMIAQAGFTAGQSMQMMQSISNLATGTLSDMKTVVDLVTSAMVVFNIESNDAARVSDVFANAVNKSKLTMDKIKTAFNYVGPVARDANVTFEESAVAMMLLANSGQRASTIGTGLRNVFSTLLSPSKKLTEAAAAVGVSLTDLDPRVNSFKDVISNLGIVVRDSQVALDVFGKRGSTAVLSLTNGIKDYDRLYSAVTKVGSAAEMAAKQQEGLYVRWKNLTDRAQLLAVTIGQSGLTEIISELVNSISGLINWLNSLSDSFGGRLFLRTAVLTTALGAVSAAIGALILFGRPLLGMLSQAHIAFSAVWGAILNNIAAIKAHIVATRTQTTAVQVNTATWSIWQKIIWATSGALIKSIASLGAVITALRSFASAFAPLLIITAISAAISTFTEAADSLKNSLQEVGQVLDRIQNQSKSVTDALEKITKLKPKTEEYANAIKAMMNAIAENKGPVAGAEEEFRALQKAINDTNDGFVDGGKALAAYLRKLKELAAVQAGFAVDTAAKLFKREVPNPYKMSDRAIQELGVTGIMDSFGGGVMYHDLTFEQTQKAIQKVAANVLTPEEIGKSKTEWARLVDTYKSLREYAEAFLEKQKDIGALNYSMAVSQVEKLAAELGESEHRLQAIVSIYKELQNVESGRIMNSILPSDVQKTTENLSTLVTRDNKDFNPSIDSEKIKEGIQSVQVSYKELHKIVEDTAAAMTEAGKLNKTNIVYSKEDVNTATEILTRYLKLQEYTKQYKEYFEQAMKEASSASISVERRERLIANIQKERLIVQRQLQEEADKISSARNVSENVASLTRGVAVHKEYLQEIEVLEKRITDTRKKAAEEVSRLSGKQAQEKKDQYEYEIAQLEEEKRRRIELATAAYGSLQRLSKPVSVYVEELLKADKKEQKIRDVQLQKELNRIHILEDAHKQSEGRIGLSFEQARAREQEAIARFTAARLAAIAKMEQDVRTKYSISDNEDQRKEYHDQLKVLNQQREKVVEDGYKRQHDLEQKYMKASMAIAKEAGAKIEKQAKKANEARKHEQEKAMHEIAQLEANGVITHEEAEKRKAEISIKYHNELIASYRKQIEELNKVGAEDNIQQIMKLEEEIGKSTHEAIKAARKGLEEQTKAIHEAKTKLEEIQGSEVAKKGAGDFSKEQQKKITEEYAAEIEKKKKLAKEGLDYEIEYTFSSTSKVAEAIRKHYDKLDSIATKSAEKRDSIERDLVKKQEDYEKKKLSIIQKYNKKSIDLANERQDVMDQIDAGGNSKKLEKIKVSRAESRIGSASSQIEAAIQSGDKDSLEAIANQLKSDIGSLAGASKPKAHKDSIESAFALRKRILDAQKQMELAEEEKKFQKEVENEKRKLAILKESAEQALVAEDGRHQLAMQHLEKEAEKMREKIKLAQEEVEIYNKAIREGEELLAKQPGTQVQTQQEQQSQQKTQTSTNKEQESVSQRLVTDEKGMVTNVTVRRGKGALPTNEVGTYQHAVNQANDGILKDTSDMLGKYPDLAEGVKDDILNTIQEMLLSTQDMTKEAATATEEVTESSAEELKEKMKTALDEASGEVDNFIEHLKGQSEDISSTLGDAVSDAVSEEDVEQLKQTLENTFATFGESLQDKLGSIDIPIGVDNGEAEKGIEHTKNSVSELVKQAYDLIIKGDVEGAIQAIQKVKAELNSLPESKTVTVNIVENKQSSTTAVAATGGHVKGYATGGQVYRRLQSRFINTGSGTKDDVPALLMKNEFVHRAAAVKKYGVDFMYKLNNLQIPKSITQMFANGGLVSNAMGAVHKFANGGLIRSTRRKLEELFAGSGVNLNVDNLNITGKMEEAANQFTSPIGMQAMSMLAKNIESGISKFVIGGPITGAALSASQIQNISAAYSTSIAKAQASGNAAIAQALTEERKRLYDLSDELQQVLASLNAEYNTEARKLNEEHKQKLKEKKEEYEKNVEEENTTYAEKVEEDEKTQKKEDEDYAESKAERDENYHTSLQEMKDNLEKERLDYEANLLSKQQALIERQNAITQLRNQLTSDKYPAGTSQHASASIEELMQAHAAYAQQLYGSDRMYILDLGGTIQRTEENEDVKKARLQQLKDAVRPMSKANSRTLNQVLTKAMNTYDPHFKGAYQNYLNLLDFYNESRGYNAYKRALAEYSGKGEKKPVEQSLPYSTYLMQHLRSDYTLPLQQAELELASAMKEDNPDAKFAKDSAKLTKDYLKATKEAEESRAETLEAREKNNADRDKSHKEKLTELKKDYDTFVEEENKSYREALAKLKEDTEQKIEDAKEGKYEIEEDTKDNTEKVIEHAKTNMRRSVAAARRDKENWLAAVQSSHRQEADKAAENKQEDIYIPRTSSATSSNQSGLMSNLMSFAGGLNIEELLKKFKNGMLKFAKGGLVPFLPGSKPNADSVLSLLSPNEFVMSAKAVRTFGTSFMNSLNNLKIPAFATGGMVGASTPVAESAIEKIVNKTVYALDLTLNNTHIGELMGEKDTIDSFMNVMNRARMGMV